MINELIFMNGYGLYVWSAFLFTFVCFMSLYILTKIQYVKESKKFKLKFGTLDPKKAEIARLQIINREILSKIQHI